MATTRDVRPKNAAELTAWLTDEVSPRLKGPVEAIAHGGTALTLLGIKPSTKDVDFAFRTRRAFDAFTSALTALGFDRKGDLRPLPSEQYYRFEKAESIVDVVDVRSPTWNNWTFTGGLLRSAIVLSLGNARLVRPDRDTVFLFKTYPLRDTDLGDLRTVIDVDPPDEDRVMALFEEQDAIHRGRLFKEDVELEPLFLLLSLRFRYAASMQLLGPKYRTKIPKIARHAKARFRELRLSWSLSRLLKEEHVEDRLLSWDRILGTEMEPLRRRLADHDSRGAS